MSQLIPQEVYMLERYTSKEYFVLARDAWDEMVRHVETCLELFVRALPPNYRRRPLWNQPDVVWGERVLPAFRSTRNYLNTAYINLVHGDTVALGHASRISSDVRGQSDSSADWMNEESVVSFIKNSKEKYYELLSKANFFARNISTTDFSQWPWTFLGNRYNSSSRGPLDPPDRWPKYRVNSDFRISTGQKVLHGGIYLPTVNEASVQFLNEGKTVPRALVGLLDNKQTFRDRFASDWILIERVPGEFVDDPLADLLQDQVTGNRVERVPAGNPCPRAGWWYTPAKIDSRRLFKEGDVFPTIERSDYGETLWIWSPDQTGPKLEGF